VNIRRFAVVSILLATGVGLAACSAHSQPGSAATTTPAQVSPAGALTNALATLKNTGYDATLTLPAQGATARTSTSVDYANKAGTQAVVTGDQTFVAYTEIGCDRVRQAGTAPPRRLEGGRQIPIVFRRNRSRSTCLAASGPARPAPGRWASARSSRMSPM
jgi:hypothetical protein